MQFSEAKLRRTSITRNKRLAQLKRINTWCEQLIARHPMLVIADELWAAVMITIVIFVVSWSLKP
jgi:hypothetical protein